MENYEYFASYERQIFLQIVFFCAKRVRNLNSIFLFSSILSVSEKFYLE